MAKKKATKIVAKKKEVKKKAKAIQSNAENELEVKKIGWENMNIEKPLILMAEKDRNRFGIKRASVVKITKGIVTSLAIVEIQFWDLIPLDKVCTVNGVLAKRLNLQLGDKVEISKEVTESEYRQMIPENPFSMISF